MKNHNTHNLYKNKDVQIPHTICDVNGDVVLGLCKDCGRGERELSEPCDKCLIKEENEMTENETQKTISDWGTETFGEGTPERLLNRMIDEVYELEDKLLLRKCTYEEYADEIADIFIVGYQAMTVMGFDVQSCINHKMCINRGRKWELNNDGTGQHIEEGTK